MSAQTVTMYPLDRDQATALATAIAEVPGVQALYPGRFGEIALLYPHVRIPGIQFSAADNPTVTIHLEADLGANTPLPHAADAVRRIVATQLPDHTIDIIFEK